MSSVKHLQVWKQTRQSNTQFKYLILNSVVGSVVVGFRSIIVKYSFSVVESGSVVVGSVSLSFSTSLYFFYLTLEQISPVKCRSAKFISRYQSIPDIFSSCCFLGLLAPPLFVNLNDFVRNADNLCRKLYSKCSVEI